MSWCDRRGLLLAGGAAALLAGCGFTPVHGPSGSGADLMGTIRADDPVSRRDFNFVAALEERLGRPAADRFALAYAIEVSTLAGGTVRGQGATRNQLRGTLDYVLTDAAGVEVTSGRVRASAAYSLTATQLANLTAREDAELRLMRMLADSVVSRLMIDPALTPA